MSALLLLCLLACTKDKDGDSGPSDGAATDGGSTDGGSTDGGSPDGGGTDGGSTDGGGTDGGGGGDGGGTGDGGGIDVPEDNIRHVLGDCNGTIEAPEAYPNQLIAGAELQRYTLQEPEAVCNDGSRAVLYVRGWTDAALQDVWSLHLQGGGGCASWEDCAIRWCGAGYYDLSKMSSQFDPEEVGAVGIMDSEDGNLLAGANQVFFYYCSSDSWQGQGSASYTPEGKGTPYTMFRRGHVIVEAAIDELEAGVVGELGEALPSLRDASRVVFNGTSGGSIGAQAHADWLSERLAANGTEVIAVFDAAHTPRTQHLPKELQDLAEPLYREIWANTLATNDVRPFVDESCWTSWGGTHDEYLCGNATWVLYNHITTPFFVRQDLRDTTGLGELAAISEDDYEAAVRNSLLDLRNLRGIAAEGPDITTVPGAYGPNCAQHVALESTDWWRVATVETSAGLPLTFQDAVIAWYSDNPIALIDEVTIGDGDGPNSDCAAVDGEK